MTLSSRLSALFSAVILLCGLLAAQPQGRTNTNGTPVPATAGQNATAGQKLNISTLGTLPVKQEVPENGKSDHGKWNAAGKMFLSIYFQSQRKGEDTQALRQQLQEQFGMRSLPADGSKSAQDYVPVILSFSSQEALREAEQSGFMTQTKLASMCTGLFPVKAASKIESIEGISRISVSLRQQTDNDESRNQTRVVLTGDSLWQENGLNQAYDGSGVVVGVIDIGFDFTHPAFYSDPEDPNSSRIMRVWNQNLAGRGTEEYDYGVEYTTASAIHAAQHDRTGGYHATHVAGTAAGGGAGTQFQGMAPGSELVFVSTDGSQSSILDGIAYIRSYARSESKPCAINISMGSPIGPHDGQSDFNVAIDELTDSDPDGFLIAASAGNDGDNPLHVEADLAPGESRSTVVEMDDPSMTYVDIWSAPEEDFSVSVFLIDGQGSILDENAATFSTQGSYPQPVPISPERTSTVRAYPDMNERTGKTNIMLQINASQAITDGYEVGIQFQASSQTDSAHLHAWVNGGSFSNPFPENPEWISGNTDYTFSSSTASSRNVIGVAAYTSRQGWNGNLFTYNEIGDISGFSSRGPLIGGAIKPDIAAPGEVVISAANSFLSGYADYLLAEETTINGKQYPWLIAQGTSMATPAVTGIMALLLQQNPHININEVKSLLEETAIRDEFTGTGASKDATWGYGKIDALAALQALEKDSTCTLSVEQPEGGTVIVLYGTDTISSPTVVAKQTVVALRAVPDPGRLFTAWWDGNTEPEREYTVARDAVISARFDSIAFHTITLQQNQGGTVMATCNGDTLESGCSLPEGSALNLLAIADEGYQFDTWWDGDTEAERSLVLEQDLAISASFSPETANRSPEPDAASVFPNPSDGTFQVECPGAERIEIFDGQGRLLYSIPEVPESFSIDMQGCPAGLYYMHILYPRTVRIAKLVIR